MPQPEKSKMSPEFYKQFISLLEKIIIEEGSESEEKYLKAARFLVRLDQKSGKEGVEDFLLRYEQYKEVAMDALFKGKQIPTFHFKPVEKIILAEIYPAIAVRNQAMNRRGFGMIVGTGLVAAGVGTFMCSNLPSDEKKDAQKQLEQAAERLKSISEKQSRTSEEMVEINTLRNETIPKLAEKMQVPPLGVALILLSMVMTGAGAATFFISGGGQHIWGKEEAAQKKEALKDFLSSMYDVLLDTNKNLGKKGGRGDL